MSGRWRWLRFAAAAAVPFVVLLLPELDSAAEGTFAGRPIALLPPLMAISLAFATGRTVAPLLGGVVAGAGLLAWSQGAGLKTPLLAVGWTIDKYIVRTSIYEPETGPQAFNLSIVGFVFALVGMVAVGIRAGGMAGVANRFRVLARSARATRMATWAMGLLIFFDDYANTVIVGGAMRPLADRMRISREKLAWIVDSTAAPVAGISILSTWVAFEISNFAPQLAEVGMQADGGYAVFLRTIPYRFYCLLTLVFVGVMSATGRDWGPMLRAERRAHYTGAVWAPEGSPLDLSGGLETEPKAGVPQRAHVALAPIAVTLTAIAMLFVWQGMQALDGPLTGGVIERIQALLAGVEDNTQQLFYASLIGLAAGVALAVGEGLLSLGESIEAALSGRRVVLLAVSILLLAWAMSAVCGDLGTRDYLAGLSPWIPPSMLPVGLFMLSCMVSFATGSSWSTMGILLPNVVLLAADVGATSSIGATAMVIISIGSVLDGSIFGDHCSPISDTTILSSTAAGSDHMDHVRTQAPYAVAVMVVAVFLGYIPVSLGVPVWAALLLCLGGIGGLVFGLAQPIETRARY